MKHRVLKTQTHISTGLNKRVFLSEISRKCKCDMQVCPYSSVKHTRCKKSHVAVVDSHKMSYSVIHDNYVCFFWQDGLFNAGSIFEENIIVQSVKKKRVFVFFSFLLTLPKNPPH